MKVGIVMPCINLWEKYTKPAIDSVYAAMQKATEHHCEFLLIDNGSSDETYKEATEMVVKEDGFRFHHNSEMWGFQKSVNFGVNHFFKDKYDYVLVLNNDVLLHSQAIVRLAERMEKGDVGMVTCMDVRGEVDADLREPKRINELSDVLKEECPESPHPNFSAFMVGTLAWDKVGEMDELFYPAYYEDNDYHHRMELVGLEAVTYPPAMFYHYGSRTQNEAIGRPLTDSSNQYAQYVRKWGGGPEHETFPTPFNNPEYDVRHTEQG